MTLSLQYHWIGPLAAIFVVAVPLAARAEPWPRLHEAVQKIRVGQWDGVDQELTAIESSSKSKELQETVSFLLARVLARKGDVAGAKVALRKAKALAKVAAPAYEWLQIEVAIAAGEKVEALSRLSKFRNEHDKFRWAAADLMYSRLYEQVGPAETAIEVALKLYEKSQLHLPRDELLARAARLSKGDKEKALWKRLLLKHPESDFAQEAMNAVPLELLSDAEHYERMSVLFARRSYERCREVGVYLWKKGVRKSDVGFFLGKIGSERLRDDYPGAATYFEAAIGEDAQFAQQALASYALVLSKLGRTAESIAVFDKWLTRFTSAPNDKRIEVNYDRARALHMSGKSVQAADALAHALAQDKSGIDYGKYAWFVGFWLYRGGAYDRAIEQFKPMLPAGNALVGGKARYWTAKALEKRGKRDEAAEMALSVVKRYPLTWYSALAEDLLRSWNLENKIPKLRDFSKVPNHNHNPFADLEMTPELEHLRMVVHLGEPDTADYVLDELHNKLKKQLGSARLLELEHDLSDELEHVAHDRQVAASKHSGVLSKLPTSDTLVHWRAIYPRAYRTHAQAAALRFGAPEWMIYAHMLQESRYQPWLISGAPAYGLLELLDRTAVRLATELKEDYAVWMLMLPSYNIHWGGQYLGALYNKFYKQLPFAMAAYNGGPMLVEYHLKVSGAQKLPLDELIDDIGPHESRNYVRMVAGHFLRYLAIYESPKKAAEYRAQLLPYNYKAEWLEQPNY